MNKFRFARLNAGTATLLVIFMTLCVTMLGLLSIASSNAERKLSEKMTNAVRSYYEADSRAQEIIADIDADIKEIYSAANASSFTNDKILVLIKDQTAKYQDVSFDVSRTDSGLKIAYSVPQGSVGYLQVKLNVSLNQSLTKRYQIKEYRIVPNEQAGYEEEDLNLWDGTIPE